jgi:hypothetical protein
MKVKSNQTEVARLECVLPTALEKKLGMELPAQTKAGQNLRTRWVEKATVWHSAQNCNHPAEYLMALSQHLPAFFGLLRR